MYVCIYIYLLDIFKKTFSWVKPVGTVLQSMIIAYRLWVGGLIVSHNKIKNEKLFKIVQDNILIPQLSAWHQHILWVEKGQLITYFPGI